MKALIILLFSICTLFAECKKGDIAGFWLSDRDEFSGRTNVVEFIKKDGKYFAYPVIFMDLLPSKKDVLNQEYSLRDREILGSVYIYNLEKSSPDTYINGSYYDFNNGKVFHLRAKLECDKLILMVSADNMGVLGEKKVYQYVNENDISFYIKDKMPQIDFSGVGE